MDDIIEKIQSMRLTRADAEIAEYVSNHLSTIGLQTSSTLAEEIGVSDTSVIRFIRKLGFKGYADFRSAMNARIAEQYEQAQQDFLMPGEKFDRTRERLKHDSLIADVSDYTLSNLEKSFSKLDSDTVDQVAEILLSSKRKYIVGFRGSASCAHYMASKLLLLLPRVISVTHADSSAIEQIMDIEEGDCLFVYSFPRHSKIHQTLMELARQKGAKVVLISDRRTTPLAKKADVVIVTHIDGLGFVNSYIAPMCISEVLALAVSNRCDEAGADRVRQIDDLMDREQLY